METRLTPAFKEFLTLTIRRRVAFMIIGGYAVSFHGFPRFTQDIDLLVQPDTENHKRLRSALVEFGFSDDELGDPLFADENTILRFGLAPNRVELFGAIPGVDWPECWAGRVSAPLDGLELNWIGLKELRKTKQASNRGKDQIDLEELPDA